MRVFLFLWMYFAVILLPDSTKAAHSNFSLETFVKTEPDDRVLNFIRVAANRALPRGWHVPQGVDPDILAIDCTVECLSTGMFLSTTNKNLRKETLLEFLEIARAFQENVDKLNFSERGILTPERARIFYRMEVLGLGNNLWRDRQDLHATIDPILTREEHRLTLDPKIQADLVTERTRLFFLIGLRMSRATMASRVQFLEKFLFHLDPESEKNLYYGLKESGARKSFSDDVQGLEEFYEAIGTLSPLMGAFINRVSYSEDLQNVSDHLARGFAGAGKQFVYTARKVFELGGVSDVERAVQLVGELFHGLGSSWSEVRGIREILTNSELIFQIQETGQKFPSLTDILEDLARRMRAVNEKTEEYIAQARAKDQACVKNLLDAFGFKATGSE